MTSAGEAAMIEPKQEHAEQVALQEHIHELEQENARLRAELELARSPEAPRLGSEPRFGRAFENAAIGYAMTDGEGRFIDANPAYCRLTGYSLEELKQRRLADLIHPEDYRLNMQLIERQMTDEIPPFVIENRYVRKDGGIVWVRKSVAWIPGQSGGPQWLLALVEDVTRQRQIEEERRTSERIYRAIGETLPYGIWICDPDGRNTYTSQSLLDLLGITQEQCSEFGWGDSLHPDDSERTIAAWKECVRTEGHWDIEHRYRGTDGEYHPILARGVPVRDESGKIICWAGINMDISRLKSTEAALRESERRFEVAVKNSPMIVYTTDRALRYTWLFNPGFGVDPAEVVGKSDEEIRRPEDVAQLVALKQSVLDTGIGRRQEVQVPRDGRVYTFDLTVEPTRDERGQVTGLTVAAIDVTENKRREQKALQSQMRIELQRRLLEQREQERMTLARDLHDGPVQTLAATGMELEMIRLAFDDPVLQAELSRIIRHIKDASKELRDTVSELRPSQFHALGLSQAIRAYSDDFQSRIPGTRLVQKLAPDRDGLSRYAALSLFRICQEALNNIARHAAATEASIRLAFSLGWATLEIRDNGKGMEPVPDLVQLTTQGHYGLAGMKERAEAVGGECQIVSAPGQGTTISVRVPLGETPGSPEPARLEP
jgi:PAS domain S-box-containing protein